MSMAETEVQKELVEAAGFEPTKNYQRQDYLAALARAVNEIPEEDFDGLSVEAQDWFNAAVKALNKKQELPEFPDAEAEGNEAAEDNPTDDNLEDDTSDEAVEEAPPKKVAKGKKPAKAEPPEGEVEDEAEEAPPKKTKGKAPRKLEHPAVGELDHFGINVNAKGHAAAAMLEKGCRMADVTASIGGTYYNLLGRLLKDGHKLEKAANGYLQLVHKDNVKKGKGKK